MLPLPDMDFINIINKNIEEVNEDVIAFFDKNISYLQDLDITQLV